MGTHILISTPPLINILIIAPFLFHTYTHFNTPASDMNPWSKFMFETYLRKTEKGEAGKKEEEEEVKEEEKEEDDDEDLQKWK